MFAKTPALTLSIGAAAAAGLRCRLTMLRGYERGVFADQRCQLGIERRRAAARHVGASSSPTPTRQPRTEPSPSSAVSTGAPPPTTTVMPPATSSGPPNTTVVPPNTTVTPPPTSSGPPNTTAVPPNTTVHAAAHKFGAAEYNCGPAQHHRDSAVIDGLRQARRFDSAELNAAQKPQLRAKSARTRAGTHRPPNRRHQPRTPQTNSSSPESARDSQEMTPESARDPQTMVPETATDSPPTTPR